MASMAARPRDGSWTLWGCERPALCLLPAPSHPCQGCCSLWAAQHQWPQPSRAGIELPTLVATDTLWVLWTPVLWVLLVTMKGYWDLSERRGRSRKKRTPKVLNSAIAHPFCPSEPHTSVISLLSATGPPPLLLENWEVETRPMDCVGMTELCLIKASLASRGWWRCAACTAGSHQDLAVLGSADLAGLFPLGTAWTSSPRAASPGKLRVVQEQQAGLCSPVLYGFGTSQPLWGAGGCLACCMCWNKAVVLSRLQNESRSMLGSALCGCG